MERLPDVEVHAPGEALLHEDAVGVVGGRLTAGGDDRTTDAVGRARAVDEDRREVEGVGDRAHDRRVEDHPVDAGDALDAGHATQLGHRERALAAVVRVDHHVPRVGRTAHPRERRRRPPGRGQAREARASGQGDEQRDDEERAPVPAQLGPQTEADRAHELRATRARTCSSTTCPTTDPVTPRPRTCRSTRRDNSPREPSGRQWCYPNAGSGGHPLTSNCQFGLITSWSTRVSLSHWAYWVASHWSAVRWSRKTSMLPMAHMVSALRS